jgi:hypothetical protein
MRTTADITDNQTICKVDKYFEHNEGDGTSLTGLLECRSLRRAAVLKFDPILQRDCKLMAIYQPVWNPKLASGRSDRTVASRMVWTWTKARGRRGSRT